MLDRIMINGNARERGRPMLTRDSVVNKDMNVLNLSEHMALDRG